MEKEILKQKLFPFINELNKCKLQISNNVNSLEQDIEYLIKHEIELLNETYKDGNGENSVLENFQNNNIKNYSFWQDERKLINFKLLLHGLHFKNNSRMTETAMEDEEDIDSMEYNINTSNGLIWFNMKEMDNPYYNQSELVKVFSKKVKKSNKSLKVILFTDNINKTNLLIDKILKYNENKPENCLILQTEKIGPQFLLGLGSCQIDNEIMAYSNLVLKLHNNARHDYIIQLKIEDEKTKQFCMGIAIKYLLANSKEINNI